MIKQLLSTVAMVVTVTIFAQETYVFSVSNEPYQDLTNSISLNNNEVWDDPQYTIPLGFDFQIGGKTVNTFYIIDEYGGGVLSSIPTIGGTNPLLFPLGQDIIDLGFANDVSQSNISYTLEGATGNQILKIEWNNVGFFDDSTESDFINFQIWFYENQNIVEYHYGPSEINNPEESYGGLLGATVAFFSAINGDNGILGESAYLLFDQPSSPTVIIVNPGDEDDLIEPELDGDIPTGTVYRFTPSTLSVNELNAIDFVVYPNPTRNFLYFKTNVDLKNINIYNQLGQRVSQLQIENNAADVSNLESGIYFLEFVTTNGSSTQKFIKK